MKKVLIVTYYWPPAGGPGVQRVLKFAKYLPEFGWQPIILTVKNGEYSAIDNSLKDEIPQNCLVYKTDSFEPNSLYKRFIGSKNDDKIPVALLAEKDLTFKKKIANWIRLNFFIPDAKIGWKPFAVREGKRIIDELKPDVIFSSSPPPTVHLIARELAKYSGIKWVADFRDPWTDIHYYEGNKRYSLSKKIDNHLEKSVFENADSISCISQLDIDESFSKKIDAKKCTNIPNGYDENDFEGVERSTDSPEKFYLIHTGAVGKERNPIGLFKAIKRLSEEAVITKDSFCLKFIGNVEDSVLNSINEIGIEDFVDMIPYLPHKKAIQESINAEMMLLLVTQSKNNRRILPGKTFEYMRMCDNILMLGPEDGETARIIKSSDAGVVIDYNNYEKIYQALYNSVTNSKSNNKHFKRNLDLIGNYERKSLTAKLVTLFT